jgi:hypothetical protein
MGTLVAIKADILFNPKIKFQSVVSGIKIDVFLFDVLLETLNINVVFCPLSNKK